MSSQAQVGTRPEVDAQYIRDLCDQIVDEYGEDSKAGRWAGEILRTLPTPKLVAKQEPVTHKCEISYCNTMTTARFCTVCVSRMANQGQWCSVHRVPVWEHAVCEAGDITARIKQIDITLKQLESRNNGIYGSTKFQGLNRQQQHNARARLADEKEQLQKRLTRMESK